MLNNSANAPHSPSHPQQFQQTPSPGRGRIAEILSRTESTLGWEGNARPLHKRLKQQLLVSPGISSTGSEDPVLSVAIAQIERRPVSTEVRDAAFYKLGESLEDYDAVLAEAVPSDLRNIVLEQREVRAYDEGTNATAKEDWPQFLKGFQQRREAGFFPTGIASLDEALGGGVHGTTMLVANKGVGKTSLLINTIHASLTDDNSTASLFYSLDGPKTRVMERLLCKVIGVGIRDLKTSLGIENCSESQELQRDTLPRLKIKERDFRTQDLGREGTEYGIRGLAAHRIVQDACALQRVCGARRILIAIDLFQKMSVETGTGASDRDAYRLDAIQNASQQLSESLGDGNFAFFITSEIRKEAGREPTMDDMKGDGRLASDADNVLAMWPRNNRASSSDVVELTLNIDKCRGGEIGPMPIEFHHKVCRFSDPSTNSTGGSRPAQPPFASSTPVDSLAE